MRVMLTQRNQITIPKNLVSELGLELGKFYELKICEGKIELDITKNYDEMEEPKVAIQESNEGIINEKKSTNNIKIVSNLEEGAKFSRQVVSDCGLVIRTKRSYLTKFCEVCKGQLAREYNLDDSRCPNSIPKQAEPIKEEKPEVKPIVIEKQEPIIEVKKQETKKIISKIIDNASKLNSQIDTRINQLNEKDPKVKPNIDLQKLKQLKKLGNRLIRPVKYPTFKICSVCEELYETGFLIDDEFYCKECAKADFYNYLDKRKECEKQCLNR